MARVEIAPERRLPLPLGPGAMAGEITRLLKENETGDSASKNVPHLTWKVIERDALKMRGVEP